MKIRDLNNEGTELNVFSDFQGDVYVSITNNKRSYDSCVRIGGCGSGHEVPPNIRKLLLDLAQEFDKYKNCRYEKEAFDKYMKEECKF